MHNRTPISLVAAAPLILLALLRLPAFAQQAEAPPVVEEPTEAQIFDADGARIARINARSRRLLGGVDARLTEFMVEDAKKLGCREIDRVGVHFDRRVELRMKQAQHRSNADIVQLWLSSEDTAWIAR